VVLGNSERCFWLTFLTPVSDRPHALQRLSLPPCSLSRVPVSRWRVQHGQTPGMVPQQRLEACSPAMRIYWYHSVQYLGERPPLVPAPRSCAASLKVKEVPTYVAKYANEHWQPTIVKRRLTTWLDGYKKQVGQEEGLLRGFCAGPRRRCRRCTPNSADSAGTAPN
jgi:hypothetical protein